MLAVRRLVKDKTKSVETLRTYGFPHFFTSFLFACAIVTLTNKGRMTHCVNYLSVELKLKRHTKDFTCQSQSSSHG